ncbi:MAG: hypothetical protein GWQ08_03225 [Verrucomicrobiaceae bacterium]|nr:hypothetical protein [Verrucomicrobiaceae bacterium]
MSHDNQYAPYLKGINYGYVDHLNDPRCELYRSFGLVKGAVWQLVGPKVWWRGLRAFFYGHDVCKLDRDGTQMPGMFLVSDGKIIKAHKAEHAGDHAEVRSFALALNS